MRLGPIEGKDGVALLPFQCQFAVTCRFLRSVIQRPFQSGARFCMKGDDALFGILTIEADMLQLGLVGDGLADRVLHGAR